MKFIFYVLAVIVIVALVGSCEVWKWGECRKVGHSVAYCVVTGGHR